ncbi:SixA phosphatase family protein [Belliella aquatica]|uniref:Phosphoglycerate mutase n=1 Tax=Belliella aquatica TaxID=1323734 RepID=A0ABQ1MQS8_9BACT|nr:histidine phosphatase family protein [Belliella aquatica]MCH7406108.1 histidine phosphatase family protein [Belliella aquatica]GGC45112.1 phosphoglycerate mutase [Belliella aquatica]
MKNNIIAILTFLVLGFACTSKQEAKTIYIVRHAEKMLDSDNPQLNVAGTVRSKKLGQILSDKQIIHAFSTNTIRTIATLQPISNIAGIAIETYDSQNHDDLVKELRKRKGNAVVVGHSNTVHHLVNYFVGDGEKYSELSDIEYDFIFEVRLEEDGSSSVKRSLYKEY